MRATHVTDVIERLQLGGETAVDTEELFVHDSSQGQRAERLHARIVESLRVLALACRKVSRCAADA